MAAVWEQNVIVTSYDVISWGCGPQWKHFWTYYRSFKFRCQSFNILGVKRWGRNPPPGLTRPKKPGLNRVNKKNPWGINPPSFSLPSFLRWLVLPHYSRRLQHNCHPETDYADCTIKRNRESASSLVSVWIPARCPRSSVGRATVI